jgi:hypothetical protein
MQIVSVCVHIEEKRLTKYIGKLYTASRVVTGMIMFAVTTSATISVIVTCSIIFIVCRYDIGNYVWGRDSHDNVCGYDIGNYIWVVMGTTVLVVASTTTFGVLEGTIVLVVTSTTTSG